MHSDVVPINCDPSTRRSHSRDCCAACPSCCPPSLQILHAYQITHHIQAPFKVAGQEKRDDALRDGHTGTRSTAPHSTLTAAAPARSVLCWLQWMANSYNRLWPVKSC